MLKMREINNLTLDEIKRKLNDTAEELSNLEFQLATHQLDDTSRVNHTRKDVARIKTVLKEIELGKRKPLGSDEEGAGQ